MKGHFSVRLRRFARDSEGATMIEFAFIFPIVLFISFGIVEISLCMASLVTLEGGLKQASRYGITSEAQGALTSAQKAEVPTYFKDDNNPRLEMIGLILNQNTLDLIDLDDATPSVKIYSSFSVVKDGEPYTDLPDIPTVGKPPNGHYDGPGTPGAPADGEPYSDMNCNGTRDGPGSTSEGAGAPGNIVVYTINYDWRILTPFVGKFLGEPDPNHPGGYRIPMSASIVVKNEPIVSGGTFCTKS
jgi:Flp pilus assembly pilin Flp